MNKIWNVNFKFILSKINMKQIFFFYFVDKKGIHKRLEIIDL